MIMAQTSTGTRGWAIEDQVKGSVASGSLIMGSSYGHFNLHACICQRSSLHGAREWQKTVAYSHAKVFGAGCTDPALKKRQTSEVPVASARRVRIITY
jgi:hypothetical protein